MRLEIPYPHPNIWDGSKSPLFTRYFHPLFPEGPLGIGWTFDYWEYVSGNEYTMGSGISTTFKEGPVDSACENEDGRGYLRMIHRQDGSVEIVDHREGQTKFFSRDESLALPGYGPLNLSQTTVTDQGSGLPKTGYQYSGKPQVVHVLERIEEKSGTKTELRYSDENDIFFEGSPPGFLGLPVRLLRQITGVQGYTLTIKWKKFFLPGVPFRAPRISKIEVSRGGTIKFHYQLYLAPSYPLIGTTNAGACQGRNDVWVGNFSFPLVQLTAATGPGKRKARYAYSLERGIRVYVDTSGPAQQNSENMCGPVKAPDYGFRLLPGEIHDPQLFDRHQDLAFTYKPFPEGSSIDTIETLSPDGGKKPWLAFHYLDNPNSMAATTTFTNGSGEKTTDIYDDQGRWTRREFSNGRWVEYGRDPKTRAILAERHSSGREIRYSYDEYEKLVDKKIEGDDLKHLMSIVVPMTPDAGDVSH